MNAIEQPFFPVRVATLEILDITFEETSEESGRAENGTGSESQSAYKCTLTLKSVSPKSGVKSTGDPTSSKQLTATAISLPQTIIEIVGRLCRQPDPSSLALAYCECTRVSDQQISCLVALNDQKESVERKAGVGRAMALDEPTAILLAAIRAANHAGLLDREYRANNQKLLREWAQETAAQIHQLPSLETPKEIQHLLTESLLLESFNKVASAAVITASNHPRPDSILSLFDTSVWLFDSDGLRRDAYTDTNLWLAWYPGVNNDQLTVDEVILSMPAAPDIAIPWIVKLFENPTSRFRFRGAVDLEDHDVLHVLLGRGLQDQDEAFVLGFAMGTAKSISSIETAVFKFILTRVYPEPYRIPNFLKPAFDLGIQCGKETGHKNLYRQNLKRLRELPLGKARKEAGIDMSIVRTYYQREQEAIPFTIASLRLP